MSDDKNKTQISAEALTAAIKHVSEQLIPAAVAAAVAATTRQAAPQAPRPVQAGALPTCNECGQKVTACEGKHVEMVVYPTKYPQHADYFTGVVLNGVKYLSNDDGHKVVVPAVSESTINGIVRTFEQNEQDMTIGRKAERHSGSISPHGSRTTQADRAWR